MPLRLLFDICHPAEVHHFRPLYRSLAGQGWRGLFVARDKDVTRQLLIAYELPHVIWSASRKTLVRKLTAVPQDFWRFYQQVRAFQPHVMLSTASLHSSYVGALLNIPHIACLDTEHRALLDRLTLPFVDIKCVSTSFQRQLSGHVVRYTGTHELAYLHPDRFHPDAGVLDALGVRSGDYVIVRFVAWNAFHDRKQYGMSPDQQIDLVQRLSAHKTVFVCSESELPLPLQSCQLPLPAAKLHDALAFAHACISEGATTAAESASVGTPALLINPFHLGYIADAERYGLVKQVDAYRQATTACLRNLLQTDKSHYQKSFQDYLNDHIDSTRFMEQFLLNL